MQYWYFLPFDHRGSFLRTFFDIDGRAPTDEERARVFEYKRIIYDGLLRAIERGVPKAYTAILVDEEYGAEIITDAKERGIPIALTMEKSGQPTFAFEHDSAWQERLDAISPKWAKVLVRYNPDGQARANAAQLKRLKMLSDYCAANEKMGLLFELLVPATPSQLTAVGDDQDRYDDELRAELTERAIAEIVAAGVEPELWKLEGLNEREDFARVVAAAREGTPDARVIVLGRGKTETPVRHWITANAPIDGVVGFAIGRTVFEEPLLAHKGGTPRSDVVDAIAQNYQAFCELFSEKKSEIVPD